MGGLVIEISINLEMQIFLFFFFCFNIFQMIRYRSFDHFIYVIFDQL